MRGGNGRERREDGADDHPDRRGKPGVCAASAVSHGAAASLLVRAPPIPLKRIAHFDRNVGLKLTPLPEVKLITFKTILEAIERYLNLFFCEFEQTTMMFGMLSAHEITGKAEVTALKARAYDVLQKDGVIPPGEWRRQCKKISGDSAS